MFTNNMIKFMDGYFCGRGKYYFNMVNVSGTSQYTDVQYAYYGFPLQWLTSAYCRELVVDANSYDSLYPGIYFGSGNTPATKADYKLESPITSGLSIVTPSSAVLQSDGDGKYIYSASFIVTNTSADEIIICEIGLFTPGAGQSASTLYLTLMERTVLSEPIIIAPGERKVVTYEITFNQTLNVE